VRKLVRKLVRKVVPNRMRAALAASLLLTAALPAAAQPPRPTAAWTPWSVESPGSLGGRFGLGVDLLLARLDEAEVVGGRQAVILIGEDGSTRTTVVPVDVELANRKHRQGWEERSFGLQVPVALPPFRLPGALEVEPSLVVEAAAVDGRLTFVDRVEGAPDRTLDGTGVRWGVGVEALGELCRGCRWFWGAGYRYRSLAGLDLGSDTRPDLAGLTVTETTEIDHDAHHLTARLGALVAGGRATVYLGVRGRSGELVVHDATTLTSPQGGPSPAAVATRLELEADDTAALAGTDFHLGRGFVGRVEATFGGEGESVLLKVVRVPHGVTPRPRPPDPEEIAERRGRAVELAEMIRLDVRELRRRFEREKNRLEREAGPDRPLPTPDVLALLDDLEQGLREVLGARELLPILSWFLDLLARARRDLADADADVVASRPALGPPPRGIAFAVLPARQGRPRPDVPSAVSAARGWLATILADLGLLETRSDTGQLTQDLCVTSLPRIPALVTLWPHALTEPGQRDVIQQSTENTLHVLYRGYYAYSAKLRSRTISCSRKDPSIICAPINLWTDERLFLTCDFRRDIEVCTLSDGDLARCGQ
jgi:hypothetical protein